MRIGIGLPTAVPGVDARRVGEWAALSEGLGFESLGVIDRLVYDNLEPLTALAAAAARTERAELMTTVLNVYWRGNPVLLAKQLASVDALSGGRLVAGMGLGGWPEDYTASGTRHPAEGVQLESMLTTMWRVWAGEVTGASGPMPAMPQGRPEVLFGGLVRASFTRAATLGRGWVAPLMGLSTLAEGAKEMQQAWAQAGRTGHFRVVTGRYFCLGAGADDTADSYIKHYYGPVGTDVPRADTLTSGARILEELRRLSEAGCTDVLFYPCSADVEQVRLLADVLHGTGNTEPVSVEHIRLGVLDDHSRSPSVHGNAGSHD